MKKFLSVIFMALCGITAIHAGNPQTVSEPADCGASVTMTADPKPHYTFTKWVMTVGNNSPVDYTVGSGQDYTCTTDGSTLINTLIIKLSSSMIDNANGGITFKAIFTEDPKYTVTGAAVNNDVNYTPNSDAGTITITHNGNTTQNPYTDYVNEPITLKATADNCYEFVKWIDANGNEVSKNEEYSTTITATTTYRAVFKKKTVTITVTTDDDDMGTVGISVDNNPTNN